MRVGDVSKSRAKDRSLSSLPRRRLSVRCETGGARASVPARVAVEPFYNQGRRWAARQDALDAGRCRMQDRVSCQARNTEAPNLTNSKGWILTRPDTG